jgi:high-affinity iron transporter
MINVLGHRLWDYRLAPQDGIIGRLLHTLIGYTDRPSELQLIAYLATLAVMAALTFVAPQRPARAAA